MSDGVNRLQQCGEALALPHIAACTGRLSNVNHVGTLVHGQQQDRHTRKLLADFTSSAKSVQDRHSDVEDNEVRPKLARFVESLTAICRFPADLDTRACLQGGANASP